MLIEGDHSRVELLPKRDELAIPMDNCRVVISVDQDQYRRNLRSSFAALPEYQPAMADLFQQLTGEGNLLHLYDNKGFINLIAKKWGFFTVRAMKLNIIAAAGTAHGMDVHINAEKIIEKMDLLRGAPLEAREMSIKQALDAVLRHEQTHVLQYMRQKAGITSGKEFNRSYLSERIRNATLGGIVMGTSIGYSSYALPRPYGDIVREPAFAVGGLSYLIYQFNKSYYRKDLIEVEANEKKKSENFRDTSPLTVLIEK